MSAARPARLVPGLVDVAELESLLIELEGALVHSQRRLDEAFVHLDSLMRRVQAAHDLVAPPPATRYDRKPR